MSVSLDVVKSAFYRDGHIVVTTESGGDISFPVASNPRLSIGSEEQLNQMEISPFGIHWPALDEDLSLRGLLAGDHGQRMPGS